MKQFNDTRFNLAKCRDTVAQQTQWSSLTTRNSWSAWEPWRQIELIASNSSTLLKKKPSLLGFYIAMASTLVLVILLLLRVFNVAIANALLIFFTAIALSSACIGLIPLSRKKELLKIDKNNNLMQCDAVKDIWEAPLDEIHAIQIVSQTLFSDQDTFYEINAVFKDADRVNLDEYKEQINTVRHIAQSIADFLNVPLWDAGYDASIAWKNTANKASKLFK